MSTVTTHCLILLAVALGGLTLMLNGSRRMVASIARISSVNVAENSKVWRCAGNAANTA
ncbi:hypothetical protein G3O00_00630 [Burkholderia sp. Ac-20384]|nr:hypothetical protein [Burkholderia sp. Ac-20384]